MINSSLNNYIEKYKVYFLIFLIIIGLGIVTTKLFTLFNKQPTLPLKYDISYFNKKTSEDRWKIYIRRNEQGNDIYYTVRQPKDWNVIETHPRSVIFTPDISSGDKKLPNDYFLIQIKESKGLSVQDYFKTNYRNYFCEEIITNNGIGCMGFEKKKPGVKFAEVATISFEDKIAEIVLMVKDQNNKELIELFPLFVSSFFGGP